MRQRIVFARDVFNALVHARLGPRAAWRVARLLRVIRGRSLP